MKKNIRYSAALVVYGIVLVFLTTGLNNLFGSNLDWLTQHTAFPDVFRKNFYETGQIFPNFVFNLGAGQNVFNIVYYGFLSPIILLSYVLPFVNMTTYIMTVSVIIYLVSGNLAFVFLKKHFGEKNAFFAALIFMSVVPINFHFHRHIMFVWYLPFLLLALIGLDRYFEKKKPALFLISSVLIIFTNYYYSVSALACLFVYAVYCVLRDNEFEFKDFVKRFFKLVYLFMIPVLASMFLLLPTAYALISNGRSYETAVTLKDLFIPKFHQMMYIPYGSGIIEMMVVAIVGNIFCKKNSGSNRFLNIVLLATVVCPLICFFLNGMLYTREKVLIPFVILYVYALCSFVEKLKSEEIDYKKILKALCVIVIVFSVFRYLNALIGLAFFAALIFVYYFRKRPQTVYVWSAVLLVIATVVSSFTENYVSKDDYAELYLDEVEYLAQETEDGIFRTQVRHKDYVLGNRIFGENFYTTSLYSSTSNILYQNFYIEYMGNNEHSRNCFVIAGDKNELFADFMGTRYIISETDPGFYYDKVAQSEHLSLYENPTARPLVYVSSAKIGEESFDKLSFPHTAEYLLTHTVVAENAESDYESVLAKCDVEPSYEFEVKETESYSVTLDDNYKDKILYLSFEIYNDGEYENKDDLDITINGTKNVLTNREWFYYNENTRFDYVLPLENTQVLDIVVEPGKYKIQNLKMYTSDKIESLYNAPADLSFDESLSEIKCSITAEKGDYLVTSIPYDEGFKAKVNGKSADVEIVNKAFVGVKLEEGENNIEISYEPPFLGIGKVVSLLGVLLLVFEIIRSNVRKRKED